MVRPVFASPSATQSPTISPEIQCVVCTFAHSRRFADIAAPTGICSRHCCVYPDCVRSRIDPLKSDCWTCEYHVGSVNVAMPSQPGPEPTPQPNRREGICDLCVSPNMDTLTQYNYLCSEHRCLSPNCRGPSDSMHPKHDSSPDGGGKPDAPQAEKIPEVEITHPVKHRHSRFRSMFNWRSFGAGRRANGGDDSVKDIEKRSHDARVTEKSSTPIIDDAEKIPPPASNTPQGTKSSTSVAPPDSEPLSQGAPPSLLVESLRSQEAKYLKFMRDLDPNDPWHKWLIELRGSLERERDRVGWHQCHAPACQDRCISEDVWVCQKHLDEGHLDRDDPPGFMDCPGPEADDKKNRTGRRTSIFAARLKPPHGKVAAHRATLD